VERRKFIGSLPMALGGALALSATSSPAQTQSASIVTNVKQFGAVGDGKTNDTAAIAAAFAYAASQTYPVSIFFPDGNYLITSGFTLPAGVSVVGSGRGSATIIAGANAITVFSRVNSESEYANITISDLCIRSEYAEVVGIQLTLCVTSCIQRMSFDGCTQCIVIDRGAIHEISNVVTRGFNSNPAGTFRFWSSVDNDYVSQVIVNNLSYLNTGTGAFVSVDPGLIFLRRGVLCYFNQVTAGGLTVLTAEGATISGSPGANFIVVENDCQGCKFSQCMGVRPVAGIVVHQGSGIAACPTFIEFNGVDIDQPIEVAVQLDESKYITFNGGMITPNGSYASVDPIVVNEGGEFATFNSTNVYGFYKGSGFYFNGGKYIRLNNCLIDYCSCAFVFAGGSHIRISGGSVTNCNKKYIGAYNTVGSYYSQIDGFNPFSVGTPSFPSSGSTVTNNMGVRCTVYVAGGDITDVSINDQAIPAAATGGTFDLEPGDTIALNYKSRPSWTWVGH
jgi:hypothetical protein